MHQMENEEISVYDYPGYMLTQNQVNTENHGLVWQYTLHKLSDKTDLTSHGKKALSAFLRLFAKVIDERGYGEIGLFERHLDSHRDCQLMEDMADAKRKNAESRVK